MNHNVNFLFTYFIEDTRRRRINDLSKLRTCLSNLQWNPKHGMNIDCQILRFGKTTDKSNLLIVTGRT
jgi:hypothetical protein